MNIVLLDQKTLGDDLDLSQLLTYGELTIYPTTAPDERYERIKDAQIVITNKVVIDRELMNQAKELKLICIAATGMNNVDLDAAKELGIVVKNVQGYSTQSVVQHTFAMALYLLEHLQHYHEHVQQGAWSQSGLFTDLSRPFYEIQGKTWGIIGLGTIGRSVAKVAECFGATIHYYSTSGENRINDYHHSELKTLLSECDIISIHAPLNNKTENLINQSNLHLLKNGAILLNLGRGGIINEIDLAQALTTQEIYVGLDVLRQEPMASNHPLLELPHPERLLITPHIAWASIEARQKLLAGILQNIEQFLALE